MASSWCFCSWPPRSCRSSSFSAVCWSAGASGEVPPRHRPTTRRPPSSRTRHLSRRRLLSRQRCRPVRSPPAPRRRQRWTTDSAIATVSRTRPRRKISSRCHRRRMNGRTSRARPRPVPRRRRRAEARCAGAPKTTRGCRGPAAAAPAPAGDGYAICGGREAGAADPIAKRLVSKGYGAYVLTPPDGRPNVYRVRVGTFKTRREAEAIASKLQKEEQFKPWITR